MNYKLYRYIREANYCLPYVDSYDGNDFCHAHYDDGEDHYKFGGTWYGPYISIDYAVKWTLGSQDYHQNAGDGEGTYVNVQLPYPIYLAVESWADGGSFPDYPEKVRRVSQEEVDAYIEKKNLNKVFYINEGRTKRFVRHLKQYGSAKCWYLTAVDEDGCQTDFSPWEMIKDRFYPYWNGNWDLMKEKYGLRIFIREYNKRGYSKSRMATPEEESSIVYSKQWDNVILEFMRISHSDNAVHEALKTIQYVVDFWLDDAAKFNRKTADFIKCYCDYCEGKHLTIYKKHILDRKFRSIKRIRRRK